jgi:hypothetical protein
MKSSTIIKIFTLSSFIVLLSGFVAYRMDVFDNLFKSENIDSPKETDKINERENLAPDSNIQKVVDTPKTIPTILPTSKSIVPPKEKPKFQPTKSENTNQKTSADTSVILSDENSYIMSGSKSTIIFRPKKTADSTND